MLVSDVIAAVRERINDPYASGNERWPDATLIQHIADAQDFLLSRRPELRLQSDLTLAATTRLAADTDTCAVDASRRAALIEYVAWRVFGADDPDKGNQTAAQDAWQRLEVEVGRG